MFELIMESIYPFNSVATNHRVLGPASAMVFIVYSIEPI